MIKRYHFDYRNDRLRHVTVDTFRIDTSLGFQRFLYIDTVIYSDNSIPYFDDMIVFNRDSIIINNGDTCKKIDEKVYSLDSNLFKIKKYYCVKKNDLFGSCYIYTNDNYGIVRIESLTYPSYWTYILDTITSRLNRNIQNDTSDFHLKPEERKLIYEKYR